MPIPTEFELTFGCGHVGVIDLSALPPDQRGGRLEYLKDKGLCGDCFEATREKRRELEQRSWVAARRKDEAKEAAAWARRLESETAFRTRTGAAVVERVLRTRRGAPDVAKVKDFFFATGEGCGGGARVPRLVGDAAR